jgi:DNA-directed RNA polymerase specialized sigma24 family protein
MDERDVAPKAESQIQRLDPLQLAIWISAAPDPQRSALALFYLDEFDYQEILDIAELKLSELSRFLGKGRRQLQAWLDSKFPQSSKL